MNKQLIALLLVVLIWGSCGSDKKKKTTAKERQHKTLVSLRGLNVFMKADLAPFYHGVASGDPLPTAVILWTRVTPRFHQPVNGMWEVATAADFKNILKSGTYATDSTRDYTVKIDVTGLKPGTFYYYRFSYQGKYSTIGRTKTAQQNNIEQLRLAFASCSNYAWGYFNAYRVMANDTLDAVIHLGDYIYEYEQNVYQQNKITRRHLPNKEIVNLADYRTRYAQYRLDEDLQLVHARHPFIAIWDDHELANNAYDEGAQNHQANEGNWKIRLKNAKKAYYEWMPVREQNDNLYRAFQYGELLNLIMLDTRAEGRTVQVNQEKILEDTSRKMIDATQFEWLTSELKRPTTWKIIGNQILLGGIQVFFSKRPEVYTDGWDGYPYQQKKLLGKIAETNNVLVLTGDFHSSFVLDNRYKGKAVAREFVVPSITSANYDEELGLDSANIYERWYKKGNTNLSYVNLKDHGYVRVILTKEYSKVNFVFVNTVLKPDGKAGFEIENKVLAK